MIYLTKSLLLAMWTFLMFPPVRTDLAVKCLLALDSCWTKPLILGGSFPETLSAPRAAGRVCPWGALSWVLKVLCAVAGNASA